MTNLHEKIAEARALAARGRDGRDGKDGAPGAPGRDGVDADPNIVAALVVEALKDAPAEIRPADHDAIRAEVERAVAGLTARDGERGPRGEQGERGPKGDTGSAPEHEWDSTKLRFRQPDGEWGEWTDLRGPRGHPGPAGIGGGESAQPVVKVNSYFPSGW